MLTQSVWTGLKNYYYTPFFRQHAPESSLLQLCKRIANLVKKCFVVLCGVFALMITSALIVIDLPFILLEGLKVEAKTVLDFYRGGRNDKGYTLEDIWAFGDAELEAKHDFIQWLFPLKEKGVNPTAPLTNAKTVRTFKGDSKLREQMLKSFEVMLAFYGFEKKANGSIVKGSSFSKKAENWLNPGNHNYLRITRILSCLKLHGLQTESKAFLMALESIYASYSKDIGSGTIRYWRNAG